MRAILTATLFSFFYLVYQRCRPEPDFSLLLPAGVARDVEDVQSIITITRSQGRDDIAKDGEQHDADDGSMGEDDGYPDDISLDEEYMDYLRALEPIPKKVHMFFPDKDYWREDQEEEKEKPILPFVEHSILSLMKLNPDWNVTVYDDDMIDDVIRKAADSNLIPREERDLLVGAKGDDGNVTRYAAHIVERSDIARLILMYTEGGFYIDVDRLISKRMEDVIEPNTRLCLPTFNDVNFCQDLMCGSRSNKLFLSMIRDATNRRLPLERRQGWVKGGSLFELGPVLYNRHVRDHVFKGEGNTHEWETSDLRKLFRRSGGVIATKKELRCNDGFLVDDSLPKCYERAELYDKYGMKSWAPQIDALWNK